MELDILIKVNFLILFGNSNIGINCGRTYTVVDKVEIAEIIEQAKYGNQINFVRIKFKLNIHFI